MPSGQRGVALHARRLGEAAGGAVGRHGVARADLHGLGVVVAGGTHHTAAHPPVLLDRAGRFGEFHDARARLRRALREHGVEVEAGHHEAVPRPGRQLGPGKVDRGRTRMHPQAEDALETGLVRIDAHAEHRRDAAGREPVPADLFARERRLVHDGDVDAVARQVVRGRRPARARPHDEDVGLDALRGHRAPLTWLIGLVKMFAVLSL